MEKKQSQSSKRFKDLKIGDYIYIYNHLSEHLSICHIKDIDTKDKDSINISFLWGGLKTNLCFSKYMFDHEFIVDNQVVYCSNKNRMINFFQKQINERWRFMTRLKYIDNE